MGKISTVVDDMEMRMPVLAVLGALDFDEGGSACGPGSPKVLPSESAKARYELLELEREGKRTVTQREGDKTEVGGR